MHIFDIQKYIQIIILTTTNLYLSTISLIVLKIRSHR